MRAGRGEAPLEDVALDQEGAGDLTFEDVGNVPSGGDRQRWRPHPRIEEPMSTTSDVQVPIRHADRFFIGGEWVDPSSSSTFDVVDSATEELFFRVAEAQAPDMDRAVAAARAAFDEGPWPRMTHAERAEYLRGPRRRPDGRAADDLGEIWPRESGRAPQVAAVLGHGRGGDLRVLRRPGRHLPVRGAGHARPPAASSGSWSASRSAWSGAIIPWNAPDRPDRQQGRPGADRRLHRGR